MRRFYKIGVLALVFCMVFVCTACAGIYPQGNHKKEETIAKMQAYAEDKYGMVFAVVDFQMAKDPSYANVMTLSDGSLRFNVFYREETGSLYDNYPQAIINQKVADYFAELEPALSGETYCMDVLLISDEPLDYTYAMGTDAKEILRDNEIVKIILVITTPYEISIEKGKWFAIYENMLSFAPKYIDLQIVQIDVFGPELQDMFANFIYLYDREWERYDVVSWLSVTSTDITSAEELVKEVTK